MNVLALTNMYPPHHYGGYELICHETLDHFRREGHMVTVLTSNVDVPGADGEAEWADRVRRELHLYWDDHRLLDPSPLRAWQLERRNQRALSDAIEASRPDVVSVWAMGAMSLGLLATLRARSIPAVFVVCDEWLGYGPRLDVWSRGFRRHPTAARLAERFTGVPCVLPDLGTAGVFCFISDHTRQAARRDAWFELRDSTVVYSGISSDDFPMGETDPRAGWRWRLLCAGRIDQRKGIDVAIRSLTHLPDAATLEVVGRGDGAYLDELHELVDDLHLAGRVCFDVASRAELRERYRAADVVLFPVRWDEPFGLVPLEAMACSTPVVATATGGSAEFLADGVNALRVPVDDPGAIAAAVQRLAGDAELRARLVRSGWETAGQLTDRRCAAAILEWHRAAAERFVHGRPDDRPPVTVAAP